MFVHPLLYAVVARLRDFGFALVFAFRFTFRFDGARGAISAKDVLIESSVQ